MEGTMTLKICQLLSIVLSAFVAGMFYGPWAALTRSFSTFKPDLFLAIVRRLNRNMAQVMTILMPVALLSIVPVLYISYREQPRVYYLNLAGSGLFIVALLVTVIVEVPIVKQFETWTVSKLPGNWQQMRNRWESFHLVRIIASIAGLVLLLVGAIF
jgi:uncharacterized membrane protein